MKILSIETSCDETAVSIIEAKEKKESPSFSILGNALFSQIDIHKEYGGVYPMLAKREHGKNLPHLLTRALAEASMFNKTDAQYSENIWKDVKEILSREEGLYESLREIFNNIDKPDIDL